MVNPDNTVYLRHILDACRRAERFVSGIEYDEFVEDEKTISAVVRELSVIGEAARKTTEEFRKRTESIPWEKIFGMRNRLVHDYMGVQMPIVWQTVKEDLPILTGAITDILAADDRG